MDRSGIQDRDTPQHPTTPRSIESPNPYWQMKAGEHATKLDWRCSLLVDSCLFFVFSFALSPLE
eukprot:6286396-Amphidinium_carterae.1